MAYLTLPPFKILIALFFPIGIPKTLLRNCPYLTRIKKKVRLWVGDTPLPPPIGALLVKNKNAYIKFISQSKWHRQESDLCNVDTMQGESIFDKRFASRIFRILGIFIPFCSIRVYFFFKSY